MIYISGNLVISRLQYHDTGTYTCHVNNHTLQVYLEVMVKPLVKVTVSKDEVKVGDSAEVTCAVEGSPEPKITWFRDGQEINNTVVKHGGKFILANRYKIS